MLSYRVGYVIVVAARLSKFTGHTGDNFGEPTSYISI